MCQIISRIRQEGTSRETWDEDITIQLMEIWFQVLPPSDAEIALNHEAAWLTKMSSDAVDVLDQIIIRQAATVGWRIGLSTLVQWRLSEWELMRGGLKLRRYHRAIEQAARIFRRVKKPPLDDPAFYGTKIETVKELRVLLTEMRDQSKTWLSKPLNEREAAAVAYFLEAIVRRSRAFPSLASNLKRWREFFAKRPGVLSQQLSGIRLRPASLFDLWFSWCKGVDPEGLRQKISRLGSSPMKPSHKAKL
jgi:hypothetical protein